MKKSIILSVIVMALMFGSCQNSSKKSESKESTAQNFNLDTTKLSSGTTFYQCKMDDHEINSDKTGLCPACEMDLTSIIKK